MTQSQRIVLILLAVSLFAGAATGNQLYYQFAYLWLFVFVGSWLWSVLSLRNVNVRRTAKALRAQVGQIYEERYDLEINDSLPRLWIEVRDESNLPGTEGSRVLTMIRGRQGRTYLARTRLLQRGAFNLGPTVLAFSDLFGLFPREKKFPVQETLVVYPMMVEVENIPNPPGLLPGGEALRRRTHQVTPNAAGVRDYVHGDALNRIHWLSSARRSRLMVKEFELDPLADVWIFLDGSRRVQAGTTNPVEEVRGLDLWQRTFVPRLSPSTEEYAVSAAASLTRAYLRRGRAVGLVIAGQHMTLLPPDRSGRQLGKVLEALAVLKADGQIPLYALIESQARHITRGSTVILITPDVSPEIVIVVDFILRRGLRPFPILIDPSSFGGKQSNTEIIGQIQALDVPVRRVVCDQNLGQALSLAP